MSRPLLLSLAATVAVAIAGCGGSSSSKPHSTGATAALTTPSTSTAPATSTRPFLAQLTKISTLTSTVPANGDVNPYGIAMVATSVGKLHAGDLLISNFNDKANNQGTGTTIDEVTTGGRMSLFTRINPRGLPGACPGGVGLTTALSVLPGGYVVVGSLPTTNGKSATARYGCLIVLDSTGHPVSTIAGPNIQGPWDMTATSQGSDTTLFVSMVFNGGAAKGMHTIANSTVVRIELTSGAGQAPKVTGEQVIANRIPWRDDPTALAIGPTGVAIAPSGTLYLADTLDNRISAIPQALTRTTAAPDGGSTVSEGKALKQPLGLALAPDGDILTTNAGNGNIVETTPSGQQVLTRTADKKTGAGSLFGLLVAPSANGVYYVDDGDNTLKLLHCVTEAPHAGARGKNGTLSGVLVANGPVNHTVPIDRSHDLFSAKKSLIPGALAASIALSACGGSSHKASSSAAPSHPASSQSSVSSSTLVKTGAISGVSGTVLVNSRGLTLYHLSGEHAGRFICTSSGCLQVWHPLTVTTGASPTGSVASLALLTRPDGTMQVAYKGMPLYTFVQDTAPGQAHGQGIKDVGTWTAVTTGAAKSNPASSSAPAAPASNGGYGY